MGGIGRAIGAVLVGAGEGLEKQTLLNEQNRRDDLANQRAIALENLRHGYRGEEQVQQADLLDRNAGRNDARDFAYDTKKNQQKFAQEKTLKSIDFSNARAVRKLEHDYRLAEGAADDARALDSALKLAGQTVDHWEVTTGGRLTAFNKQGEVLRQSQPGQFVPSRTSHSESDDEGGTISNAVAARDGGGKPASAPAPATAPTGQAADPAMKGRALAQLGTVYAEVTANPGKAADYRKQYPGLFGPDGKLLPKETLIQRVNQRYGG